MAGFPKGTRLKKDEDKHRHRFTVMLTDAEREDLYRLSKEWDELFAVVFRKCFKIVCNMTKYERWESWREVSKPHEDRTDRR